MKIKILHILMFEIVTLFGALEARAQSGGGFSLSWSTCDSGGGACVGGVFAVSGTVGQPDASVASGGNFSLVGGFWPGIQEARPSLRIEPYNGFVIVAWSASFTGFSLHENGDLRTSNWSAVAAQPVEFNGEKLVLLPATASARFFRLFKP